jgi:hypothetical protein
MSDPSDILVVENIIEEHADAATYSMSFGG